MLSLKNSMTWDEEVYGREYDLDVFNVVAVDDFNMGAMENKGLNIFNSKYVLADQESATDTDYQGIEAVIGHEYFHNWSGNRVTCRDWFQLSLKEGFTVFRDQEFSADMGSRGVKRILDVQTLRTHQFKEDAGPMAHPIRPESYQEINNFYTVTIYEKGAEVIRMLHRLVGADGFRKATDYYFDRFDGQAVTTEDFVQSIEKTNDIDLNQFRLWYSQAGTPLVTAKQHYDQGRGVLTLSLQQSCVATPGQSEKLAFQIPIAMALFAANGKLIEEKTLVLSRAEQHFDFGDLVKRPVVSLLRGFSAPINLEFEQSDDELAHLIQHESDDYAAWQAMQQLSLNLLLPVIKENAAPNEESPFDEDAYQRLLQGYSTLLGSKAGDKAILAEMLTLPSAGYLAELCKPINPQRVVNSKESLSRRLANDLQAQLESVYLANQGVEKFKLDALAMAERKLKNTALALLLTTEKANTYELALKQYQQASNMTDRLAAFVALIHSSYPDKENLIADFYAQWQNNTLVLDKWFAVQATIPDPKQDVLASVMGLMKHSAFSINNPNKVRSLVGAFTSNMRAFHRQDGAGYALLADIIIRLNEINPQIGARLAGTFNNWRAYDDPYSSNMKTQLERIKAQDKLSRDISEIVGKALLDQ
jgi:aminopeptidase N